jgi:serine/threonine-protein kinase RsbW
MSDPSTVFACDETLQELRAGLERIHEMVGAALTRFGFDEGAAFAIRLALEEAIVNGFRHGNRNDPTKVVFFRSRIDDKSAWFEIEDQGPGFDPKAIPDPTDQFNIEMPSGRGVMLINAYMTEAEYIPPGNRLRMVYRKPQA